jgi:hypothetical protein
MKNIVFWDVTLSRSWVNRRLRVIYLHLNGRKIRELGTGVSRWLQAPADADFSLANFSTLKREAIDSSETSVNPASTQRHIPKEDILLCFL